MEKFVLPTEDFLRKFPILSIIEIRSAKDCKVEFKRLSLIFIKFRWSRSLLFILFSVTAISDKFLLKLISITYAMSQQLTPKIIGSQIGPSKNPNTRNTGENITPIVKPIAEKAKGMPI